MSSVESLKNEHAHLRRVIEPMQQRLREIEEALVAAALDVRRGDYIICGQGHRHQVARCWAEYNTATDKFDIRMVAQQIKLDGTPSQAGAVNLRRKWRKEWE